MARDEPVYGLDVYFNRTEIMREQEVSPSVTACISPFWIRLADRRFPLLPLSQRACHKLGMPASHLDPSCWRMFSEAGHFEDLIVVGAEPFDMTVLNGTGDPEGMRYTPYLTSTLGVIGPEDTTTLPEQQPATHSDEDEPDFAYDWHISFSTVSAGRLATGLFYHAGFSTLTTPGLETSESGSDGWVEALRESLSVCLISSPG